MDGFSKIYLRYRNLNLSTIAIYVYGRKSLFLTELEKVWQKIRTYPSRKHRLVGTDLDEGPFSGRAGLFMPFSYRKIFRQVKQVKTRNL